MPSVDATWNGKCSNCQVQQDLCQHLLRISEISNDKTFKFFGINAHSILYDEPVGEKQYLISSGIFGQSKPPDPIEKVENGVYLGKNIGLYGLDFSLYDPRNYTPPFALEDANRLSFVFIRSQVPELDGRLIQAYSVNQDHYLSKLASSFLDVPVLDLRYYLMEWTSRLLGWVKHFYIPDLYYWLYGVHSLYDLYYKDIEPNIKHRESIFESLLFDFIKQADNFSNYILKNRSERMKVKTSAGAGKNEEI